MAGTGLDIAQLSLPFRQGLLMLIQQMQLCAMEITLTVLTVATICILSIPHWIMIRYFA